MLIVDAEELHRLFEVVLVTAVAAEGILLVAACRTSGDVAEQGMHPFQGFLSPRQIFNLLPLASSCTVNEQRLIRVSQTTRTRHSSLRLIQQGLLPMYLSVQTLERMEERSSFAQTFFRCSFISKIQVSSCTRTISTSPLTLVFVVRIGAYTTSLNGRVHGDRRAWSARSCTTIIAGSSLPPCCLSP